jgi:hypothetical protein
MHDTGGRGGGCPAAKGYLGLALIYFSCLLLRQVSELKKSKIESKLYGW